MGLIAHTIVPAQPLSGEMHATFGPEDELPEWAAIQIGAHLFENGEHPFPDSNYPGKAAVPEASAEPDGVPEVERPPGAEPPRVGRGSSRDAWIAFAVERGMTVADGATRDQIIADLITDGVIADKP